MREPPGRPPRAAPADVVRSDRATAYVTTERDHSDGGRSARPDGAQGAGPHRGTGHGARGAGPHGARGTQHGAPAPTEHGARGASAGPQRSTGRGLLAPPPTGRAVVVGARGPAHARGGGDVGRARRRSVVTGVDWC
ncbi:hypothetical protein GCM10023324_66580 [Streptomyces youssoufiensis]